MTGSPLMRAMVDSDVRRGMARTRWRAGPQVRAPLLTRKRNETNTAAANTMISTRPNVRSWRKSTAHGYRKTISMSKMMKIIATR